MTGFTATGDDAESIRQRLAAAAASAARPGADSTDLESIVVRYENRTDRCTITPRECTDADRLTTWLSADIDAFVALEEMR